MMDSSVIEHLEGFPSRIRNDGIIEDFCDGATFKNHPFVLTRSNGPTDHWLL
jgi:hypothetical protein